MKYSLVYFQKLFGIKPPEARKAFLLQLYVFILITTLLIVKPSINSLFLSKLTAEALPIAYLLTALFAVLFSFIYDRLLWSYKLIKIIIWTLILCSLLLSLFSFLINFEPANTGWLYIPYIFVAIYGLLTTSQFWILSNLIFNIREAKRLFGFIGAGAIAGGIFGGYLTSFLSQFIASENLLLVAAGLLLICIPISTYLWRKYVHKSKVQKLEKEVLNDSPPNLIRKSRLLSLLTLTVGLGVIVAKLVDYQYSHFAAEKIPDAEELTSFFGFWFSTLSVVSLLIQLFLTKRVLRWVGLGKAMMILPLGILLGSILLIIVPELWVVVIIKIADGSLKQSLNKASSELVYIPIPIEIKKHTKSFIDIVVDSLATGLAGCILIFLIHGLSVPSVQISYINIVLIGIWLFLISRVFRAYLDTFRTLLVTQHPKAKKHEPEPLDTSKASAYAIVDRVLKNGTPSQILYMLERTLRNPDTHYFHTIASLLDHPSAEIRAMAIENLYYLDNQDLSDVIKGKLNDPSDLVVIDALRYLIHKDHDIHDEEVLDYEALSDHKNIKALTLLAAANEAHTDQKLKELLHLSSRVDYLLEKGSGDLGTKENKFDVKAAIQAIGLSRLTSHYHLVSKFLRHDDIDIVRTALESAGEIREQEFIPVMVAQLQKKEIRSDVEEAIIHYGVSAIPVLKDIVEKNQLELNTILFIPSILLRFESQRAVDTLVDLIDSSEYAVSIQALEALKHVRAEQPEFRIKKEVIVSKILDECHVYQNMLAYLYTQVSVQENPSEQARSQHIMEARKGLITLLGHRVDGHLNRLFKLIGIHYFEEDVEPILDIALNGDAEQRANAIEFIDNILETHLKNVLLPIIDNAHLGAGYSKELIRKLNLPDYTESECFRTLLNLHDMRIKHAVLYLMEQLGNSSYIPMIEPLLSSPFKKVRQQAEQVLKKLRTEVSAPS